MVRLDHVVYGPYVYLTESQDIDPVLADHIRQTMYHLSSNMTSCQWPMAVVTEL